MLFAFNEFTKFLGHKINLFVNKPHSTIKIQKLPSVKWCTSEYLITRWKSFM